MTKTITVTEMERSFAGYINQVEYLGERFILTSGNKPIAEIRPLPVGRKLSELPEIMASLPHLGPEDAEAFGKDKDDARCEMNKVPI